MTVLLYDPNHIHKESFTFWWKNNVRLTDNGFCLSFSSVFSWESNEIMFNKTVIWIADSNKYQTCIS